MERRSAELEVAPESPPLTISSASRSFSPQRYEPIQGAENEAKPYQIPRLQRASLPIHPVGAIPNIEKIALSTNFFSSLLAVGWCQLTPRHALPWLDRKWWFQRVDDVPVCSISCFFVRRAYRRQGVMSQLSLRI
jgi:hypothetical protein